MTIVIQMRAPASPPPAPPSDRDVVFQAGLLPVSETLAHLAAEPVNPDNLRGKINRGLVETAAQFAPGCCVAAFYALQGSDGQEKLIKAAASRETSSLPDAFERDKGKGSFLIDIAEGEKDRYVKRLAEDPDEWRIELVDEYETALFIPVRAGGAPKGLFMFQAATTGIIPEEDEKQKLIIIAHLLGASQGACVSYAPVLPSQANGSTGTSPSVGNGEDRQMAGRQDSDNAADGER
jgi:hypothetical protein